MCGHLLRYEAPPARAELAPFTPLKHHSHGPEFEKTAPSRTRHHHKGSLRRVIHEANEFINTRSGQLVASAILAGLLVYCVVLFFRWDRKRRQLATPVQPVETLAPRASAPAKPIPVVLPDIFPHGEEPDPFTLPPEQVIEPGAAGS
jgi:hypothetical protein